MYVGLLNVSIKKLHFYCTIPKNIPEMNTCSRENMNSILKLEVC